MIDPNPQSQIELIAHLPGDILLSLARNEAATKEMRKAAVKLMIDNGFPQYKHPELVLIVLEIEKEREADDEVVAIVETAIEAEIPKPEVKTEKEFKAGFTTADMNLTEVIK